MTPEPTENWRRQAGAVLFHAGPVDAGLAMAPEIRRSILGRLGLSVSRTPEPVDVVLRRFLDHALGEQESQDPSGIAAIRELLCLTRYETAAEAAAVYRRTEAELRKDAAFAGSFDPAGRLSTRLTLAGWALGRRSGRRIWSGESQPARLRVEKLLVRAIQEALARGVATKTMPPVTPGSTPEAKTTQRLELLSRQFAVDLDLVSVAADGAGGEVRLSDGHYVSRTQELRILEFLRRPGGTDHVRIIGDAGHGKSSLLWSLHRQLESQPGSAPILVSATWLMGDTDGAALVTVDDVVAAAQTKQRAGMDVTVLLDTADLLLHGEAQRLQVIELKERLAAAGVSFALTVRPREADMLTGLALERVELSPYDDSEIAAAISALVNSYCPETPVETALDLVRSAVARGLPVREVVRNPLTLRMWFENASPNLPSTEVDVTSIYRDYWRIRVESDRRGLGAQQTATDYSDQACALGIAMLGLGSPELTRDVAHQYAASQTHEALPATAKALDELVRRGVLTAVSGRIRFFHQTLFEFAAAKGLQLRPCEPTLATLTQRLKGQPDDLFVAAAMEQYLILVAHDPAAAQDVSDCLTGFLGSGHPALIDLALVVWAHHPELDLEPGLPAGIPTSALRRFTLVAPTVAGLDLDRLVDRLAWFWNGAEHAGRRNVLELLIRIAPREPAAIARAMAQFDCVGYFIAARRTGDSALSELPAVLEQIAPVAPHQVRANVMAILSAERDQSKGREMTVALLQTLVRTWPVLGTPELLEQVVAQVQDGQQNGDRDSSEVRRALGELMAAAWGAGQPLKDEHWEDLVEAVALDVERDDESPRAAAGVHAITRLLAQMPAGDIRIGLALDRFWPLQGTKAPWQPTRGPFADLLVSGSPAADNLAQRIVRALEGLPAPTNHPATQAELLAAIARQTLDHPRVPPSMVAEVLAKQDIPSEIWVRADGLASLAAAAAVGGLAGAREATTSPSRPYAEWPERVARIFYRRLQPLVPDNPDFFAPFLMLAERLEETAGLRDYAKQGHCIAELESRRDWLEAFVLRLMHGKPKGQGNGANLALDLERAGVRLWDADGLRGCYEVATDAWARATLVEVLAERALHDASSIRDVIRMCRGLVGIQINPPRLLPVASRPVPPVVMEAARTAWLRVLAASTDDPADVPLIISLALAPRINVKAKASRATEPGLIDSGLVVHLGEAAVRYVSRGDTAVATAMVVDAERMIDGDGQAGQSHKAANHMRGAFRAIVRRGSTDEVEALIRLAYGSQPAWGELIVTTMATEGLTRFHTRLRALMQDPDLPPSVVSQIHLELKSRARVTGAGQFPEILEDPVD